MNDIRISRRILLARMCQLPAVGLAALAAGCSQNSEPGIACVDPAQLAHSDGSLRGSLQYMEYASDQTMTCSGCAYFHNASTAGECGTCDILRGPVNSTGHCTSWTAKK